MSSWLPAFRAGVEAVSLERLLKAGGDAEREAILAEARHALEMHGLRELHVLQTSPAKARSVILCDHPELGRCVLKFVSSQAVSGIALAHTESIRRVAASGHALFPAVFRVGPGFSIEEYVEGTTLHQLPRERWASVELAGFFAQLRSFQTGGDLDSTSIGPAECKIIVFRFVRKIVRSSRYAIRRPWPYAGWPPTHRAARLLDTLLRETATLNLPRSRVFTDLTPANVVRAGDSGKLYVVDVEHLNEGFFGFDCLWLLAMLTRTHCPVEVIAAAYREVCTDSFCGTAGAEILMRAMFAFLLEILGSYVGWQTGRGRIRHLRNLALSDLGWSQPGRAG